VLPVVKSKPNPSLSMTSMTDSDSDSVDEIVRRRFEMCLVDILFWLPSTPAVAPLSPIVFPAVAPLSPIVLSEPSSLPRTSVTVASSVDNMVRWQFEICLLDILFWPNFNVVSLKKTPAKVSFTHTSVAPVAEIHAAAEIDDDDSESDDFYCSPAVELFPEDQEQELNFIVEGCVFRGDLEIPTPPPSDAEQEDAPPDRSDSSFSPEGFRFDEPQFDSDGRSIASTCSSPSRYPDSDMDDYCGGAGDPCEYGDY
jgi:hypothetical protein